MSVKSSCVLGGIMYICTTGTSTTAVYIFPRWQDTTQHSSSGMSVTSSRRFHTHTSVGSYRTVGRYVHTSCYHVWYDMGYAAVKKQIFLPSYIHSPYYISIYSYRNSSESLLLLSPPITTTYVYAICAGCVTIYTAVLCTRYIFCIIANSNAGMLSDDDCLLSSIFGNGGLSFRYEYNMQRTNKWCSDPPPKQRHHHTTTPPQPPPRETVEGAR